MNIIYFISGGEIAVILLIVIMVFGADKIPDIARNLGKAVNSVRNATDEIKSEINKSSEKVTNEYNKVDIQNKIDQEATKVKEEIDEITGPIKRKF
jgi:sec-independent protein translocase protein TatA